MKSSEIRQAFLDYFAKRGHEVVESSSLIPDNDPTLLFTNAGMVQFKETFLGLESRPYTRAVSSQRCVRAGGKHNDLENVGYTARHHTFFEMLGNFSFGDYFKREAIVYAWEFLTKVLKLPVERLWVTVYEEDDEAADIWLKEIGVSAARFSRCGEADNFWSMGETGPCGPCSEIFYDHGPEIPGGPPGSPNGDLDRYIEIWNLVFMQYDRDQSGHLHPLPKPSVDTGMGLERMAAVVQGVHNNYDIDSFQSLIQAIAKSVEGVDLEHPSFKVIADHIRACSFLISDGVLPGNEGRGYVLRRIIRRAVRHGHKLGLPPLFFSTLVHPLARVMGEAYPELITNQSRIEHVLEQEENQFARTLNQGLQLLQSHIQNLDGVDIPGEVAFKLYDTYGFPVDLTADIAREHALHLDMDGFERCMQQQRRQSQSASQFQASYSGTGQLSEHSTFCGYEQDSSHGQIMALLLDGQRVTELTAGHQGGVVLDVTPFYAEGGGQIGDQGQLIAENGTVFRVDDTQREGQAIVHYGTLISGKLVHEQQVESVVDVERRDAIRLNHTATHLLHAALKQIIGPEIQQKGSLVEAERARFDLTHHQALTIEQIQQVESLVNERIRTNEAVTTELMSLDEAKHAGAVALFGEKYRDVVRVLSMGDFSKELCGGTHARQTGDIGLFKVTSEYGIASGVRRIEFVTGKYALQWVNQQLDRLRAASEKLKTTPVKLIDQLSQLIDTSKQQEKELTRLQTKLAAQSGNTMLAEVQQIGDVNLLVKQLKDADSKSLRATLDQLKSNLEKFVLVLYTIDQDKMNVIAGVSKDILGRAPTAAMLVRQLCGKGGGRDDMAQGGGAVPDDLEKRLSEIPAMIK